MEKKENVCKNGHHYDSKLLYCPVCKGHTVKLGDDEINKHEEIKNKYDAMNDQKNKSNKYFLIILVILLGVGIGILLNGESFSSMLGGNNESNATTTEEVNGTSTQATTDTTEVNGTSTQATIDTTEVNGTSTQATTDTTEVNGTSTQATTDTVEVKSADKQKAESIFKEIKTHFNTSPLQEKDEKFNFVGDR